MSSQTRTPSASGLGGNRSFQLLLAAYGVSALGSAIDRTAVPMVALALTGSAVSVGIVAFVLEVSTLIGRVFAGAVVDRFALRPLMLISDGFRTGLVALLALLFFLHVADFWSMVVILPLVAILGSVFEPAILRAISVIVATKEVPRALGLNEARSNVCEVLGPPLSGLLLGVGRAVPFAVDAISYGVSFLAVRRLQLPAREVTATEESYMTSLRAGASFVFSKVLLKALLAYAAVSQFVFGLMIFGVIIAQRSEGASPFSIGLFLAAGALGGVIGTLTSNYWLARFKFYYLVLLFTLLAAAALSVLATSMAAPSAIALFLLQLVGVPLNGRIVALLMSVTPTHLQGRVLSASLLVASAVAPLAPLAGGFAIGSIGPTKLFLSLAATEILVLITLAPKRMRATFSEGVD